MTDFEPQLKRIEEMLDALIEQRVPRDYHSTADVAEMLNKAEFTVREWCRLGRVNAEKRESGRGKSREWMISHEEFLRLRTKGLLPVNGGGDR